MFKLFGKKELPELDDKELLPFCTRCFNVGAIYGEGHNNFCHMCGSGGTCVPMERGYIRYLWDNLDTRIDKAIEYGKRQATLK